MNRLRAFVRNHLHTKQAPLAAETAAEIPPERVEAAATTTATPSLAAAYYPSWSSWSRPPESLDFSKYDILFYAFATPSATYGLDWDEGSTGVLKRLVAAAKKSGRGTRVVLSVGGWRGCKYFSDAVSTSANRGKLVTALKNAVNTYGLDGVDLDWEYPNAPGNGNKYTPQDSANFLIFITSLRKSLGTSRIISAAVPDAPWFGPDSRPLRDVRQFAAQMTYVNIMNYDVWLASASPGPNAPLADGCHTSPQPSANATAAVKAWSDAGFPKNKILLGLPLYGYVSNSTKTTLVGMPGAAKSLIDAEGGSDEEPVKAPAAADSDVNFLYGAHDRTEQKFAALAAPHVSLPVVDHTSGVNKCCGLPSLKSRLSGEPSRKKAVDGSGKANGEAKPVVDISSTEEASRDPAAGSSGEGTKATEAPAARAAAPTAGPAATGDLSASFGSQIAFKDILGKGALARSGTSYVAANGYTRAWDGCSSTPYLYNQSRSTVVTYDDPQSLAAKASWANSQGLAGCFTWSLDQDDSYNLQNSIRAALGK